MSIATTAERFVGIEVSKARVDVQVRPDGTAFGCATDLEGLGTLVARLQPLWACLVVLEAGDGYEGVVPRRSPKPGCLVKSAPGSPGRRRDWPAGQDRRDRRGSDRPLRPSRAVNGAAIA